MKQNRVSKTQALLLHKLGFKEHTNAYYWLNRLYEQAYYGDWNVPERQFISAPTVDEVIDWLRRKHNIIVYNVAAPFVNPTHDNNITYVLGVKECNPIWGWNQRVLLSKCTSDNIYVAKRKMISVALKHLLTKKKNHETKR